MTTTVAPTLYDANDALTALHKFADPRPGKTNEVCQYVGYVDGVAHPICLIGHVLMDWGVPDDVLGGHNTDPISDTFLLQELHLVGFDLTPEAVKVLRTAQEWLDDAPYDNTWAAAIEVVEGRRHPGDW